MIDIDVNETALAGQIQALDAALSTNPKMEKMLTDFIRKVIADARQKIVTAASSAMGSDPRGAAQSVKRMVYKKVLGANINIYNSKKGGKATSYEPPRTLQQGQRGGNRVSRGERTRTIMSYGPGQRAFILRFINSGAYGRTAGTRNGKLSGNRGDIAARNFFSGAAESAMTEAADRLANMIDAEISEAFKE